MPNRRVHPLTALVVAAVVSIGSTARAEQGSVLAMPSYAPLARPMGGAMAAGHVGAGPMGGPLLGVEGAWAATFAAGGDPSQGSPAFAVRAGWSFPNGLAVHVRYDDLGVEPAASRSPLQLATAGLRYSVPFIVPMPFAEVDAGPAFAVGTVSFGAGGALGLSLPIAGLVLVDLVVRDWFVPIADNLRQTLVVGFGLTVLFPTPGGH